MSTAIEIMKKKSGYLIHLHQIARLMNFPKFHYITSFHIFCFRPDLNLLRTSSFLSFHLLAIAITHILDHPSESLLF